MILKYENDGIDHINTYSKSRTDLGRLLTNFAHSPFVHPYYGKFESMEGFWYFIKTGACFDVFKNVEGFKAKQLGKKYAPSADYEDSIDISEVFKDKIKTALRLKLKQNKHILWQLISTDLPLAHYYVYGNNITGFNIKKLPQYDWIIQELEYIRKITKDWYLKKYGFLPNIPINIIDN